MFSIQTFYVKLQGKLTASILKDYVIKYCK